jgi:ubiquinone/menaquinone biosynthesis C-methylase UbiE
MNENKNAYVCPMRMAGILTNKIRLSLHNPNKILKPFIKKNMVAIDIGCGPGVFSIEIAKLLEGTGKVISVDMQEQMLELLKNEIKGKPFENNIALHKCTQNKIGLNENVDFVLMFYMVHEVPNKNNMFNEVLPKINKNGLIMIVEPFWISGRKFKEIIKYIIGNGFEEEMKLKGSVNNLSQI